MPNKSKKSFVVDTTERNTLQVVVIHPDSSTCVQPDNLCSGAANGKGVLVETKWSYRRLPAVVIDLKGEVRV